jgi:hypothetical protein
MFAKYVFFTLEYTFHSCCYNNELSSSTEINFWSSQTSIYYSRNTLCHGVSYVFFSVQDWQVTIGNEWGKLSEQQKSEYMTQHRKALEVYKREIQIWEEKMIRLGHIDVVRNEALILPRRHSTRESQRPSKSEE